MNVDRLVFASLLIVTLVATAAGYADPAVPRATASAPLASALAAPDAARPAETVDTLSGLAGPDLASAPPTTATTVAPVVNLPAGGTPVTAPAGPVFEPSRPVKWLPSGKGMWIYEPAKTENGNVAAIVAKAKATGLTHLWVRMGSAWDGFNVAGFVNQLVPAAHAAGIRVIGWDFPKLEPVDADVQRALTMIRYTTPGGHRIDAFSADIETRAEGTRLSADAAKAYGSALRAAVGADYPLIVTVPRPSKEKASYPWAEVQAGYDAIAPMVYWLDRQPDTDVAGALRDLARFNKPIYPVGQAYDGSPEGGRKGVPPPEELLRFLRAAQAGGAAGVSFWSWQAANQPAWDTVRDATEFSPPPPAPPVLEHMA